MDKGVTFDKFQERANNYVLDNYWKAEDVFSLLVDLSDPPTDFETKHAPAEPTAEDQGKKTKTKMWEMRLRRYLDREEILHENIHKLDGLVIGQCTPDLHSVVKGENTYLIKSGNFDAL